MKKIGGKKGEKSSFLGEMIFLPKMKGKN